MVELQPSAPRLVQLPVPPVRPLLRRTIKRFLRLLPSVLLLLFVVSLIFVTLMQIAVIHAHRRSLAFQGRSATSGGNSSAAGALLPNSKSSATSGHGHSSRSPAVASKQGAPKSQRLATPVKKKADVLRIEALLDRSSPSYETNIRILQNFVNSARIKEIIKFAQSMAPAKLLKSVLHPLGSPADVSRISKDANGAQNNRNTRQSLTVSQRSVEGVAASDEGDVPRAQSRPLLALGEDVAYSELITRDAGAPLASTSLGSSNKSGSNKPLQPHNNSRRADASAASVVASTMVAASPSSLSSSLGILYRLPDERGNKSLCPPVPPKLVGRIRVETRPNKQMSDISQLNPGVRLGGRSRPANCTSRHRVAVIIPYRDRMEHLATLLYHLHPILQRQQLDYQIYVVEQAGNETFNKGVLMNAGVRESLKEGDFHCFVFHDVDLIPEDDRNLYSCPYAPRHMSVAVDKFNYTLPYSYLVGGVFAISKGDFVVVNGYSNLYWGWGGEDDDMAHRLKYQNLHIIRPPDSIGRYTMIKHTHRAESPNNVRSALLRMAKRRATRDGLSSVRYKVLDKDVEPLYTKLSVEIGHIHKWHFPSPNKLVLHF